MQHPKNLFINREGGRRGGEKKGKIGQKLDILEQRRSENEEKETSCE